MLTSNLFLTQATQDHTEEKPKHEDGSIQTIVHESRTLLQVEKNYTLIKKDNLWVVFALKKFHRFLRGTMFFLQKDRRPLIPTSGSKEVIYSYG